MKGVVINATMIVGDDGKYYRFEADSVREGVASAGDRVAFRIDGVRADDIFIISEEGVKPKDDTTRSEQTKEAFKESAVFSRARAFGIASGVVPILIKIFAVFKDFTPLVESAVSSLGTVVGMVLTYFALGGIAKLAGSDKLPKSFGKAVLVMFVQDVVAGLALYLEYSAHPLARLMFIIQALLLIYVFVVLFVVYLELARLSRNGLFKPYIYNACIGTFMVELNFLAIFGFFFLLFAFIVYIVAWVKTDKVGNAHEKGLYIY